MSWDFYLYADLGGPEPIYIDSTNYTYNVSRMFFDAFFDYSEKGIRCLDSMACKKAKPVLLRAISKMEANPEKYRAWNPENGWGSYNGALDLLRKLLGWCEMAPDGFLVIH